MVSPSKNPRVCHVRCTEEMKKKIEKVVSSGIAQDKSEFVKEAIRQKLEKIKVSPIVSSSKKPKEEMKEEMIHIRCSDEMIKGIEKAINAGVAVNRSEFIRSAINEKFDEFKKPSTIKKR